MAKAAAPKPVMDEVEPKAWGETSPPGSEEVVEMRRRADMLISMMESLRWSWWSAWRLLARFLQPRLGRFLPTANASNRGVPKNQSIINNTGTKAADTFTAGMMGGASAPSRPWFRISVGDDDLRDNATVKEWCDEVGKRMMRVFADSNFYQQLAACYEHLGVMGTTVMLIYEDWQDVIRCYTLATGEYCLANDHRLDATTLSRRFVMTAREMVGKFGLANCSAAVQQSIANHQDNAEYVVAHLIEKNPTRQLGKANWRGKLYRELYYEWAQSRHQILQVKGFEEKPFLGARWNVTSNDPYGRSCGMNVIGDTVALQVLERREAEAVEKVVKPPMIGDARLRNEGTTSIPGGVTWTQPGAGIEQFKPAYQIDPRIDHISNSIGRHEKRIKEGFFADLWLMISQLDTVRSATEVAERKEEKMLQLGPALERMHGELLGPAIERVYAIMLRGGLLPPAPQELQGRYLGVEFISMLAQAQRAVATTAMERLAGFVGNLAAGQEGAGKLPDALDKLDTDELIDEYADAIGAPPKVVVSAKKVAALRAARAKAQQQQQSQQNALAAVQGAQTLSKIDVGGGQNAVARMLGAAA